MLTSAKAKQIFKRASASTRGSMQARLMNAVNVKEYDYVCGVWYCMPADQDWLDAFNAVLAGRDAFWLSGFEDRYRMVYGGDAKAMAEDTTMEESDIRLAIKAFNARQEILDMDSGELHEQFMNGRDDLLSEIVSRAGGVI